MEIVDAQSLTPAAPAGLEALVVHRREPAGETRRLCAAGDVGLSGALARATGATLAEVAPVLRSADLSFANLETPLLETREGRLFAAPAGAARLLAEAGFGLLNLANNHVLDYGPEGLASTRTVLAEAGVRVLGAGPEARRLVTFDLGGLALGWLGAARTLQRQPEGDGFWEYDSRELEGAVRAARSEVDVLAVSIHMGYMYVDYPHPDQRRQALALARAGADLVLLHHAHVLQGVEVVEGRLVCYNLGNFLLDWTEGEIPVEGMVEEQRTGGLFVFDLDRRGVCRAAVMPVRVDDGWTLRWAMAEEGRAVLERISRLSSFDGADAAFHRQMVERLGDHTLRSVAGELRRGGPLALVRLLPRLRPHHLRTIGGHLWRRLWR